jgi:membrane-associated phospholipid phosphatase
VESRSPTRPTWLLQQLAFVLLGVALYFGIRHLTAGAPGTAVAHAHDVLRLERRLRLNIEASSQAAVAGRDLVVDVANWVYIWGHWPVIAVVLLFLALRHRTLYARLRNAMLVSGLIGMVVFACYPVAPPRLASLGVADTVTERSQAYRVLQPPAFVNQYAAMPSLHVGWDLLVGLALLAAAGPVVLRIVGVLLPSLMATAVVVTGNHYVLDVVAGVALALFGHLVALRLERRREQVPGPRPSVQLPEPRRPEPRHAARAGSRGT